MNDNVSEFHTQLKDLLIKYSDLFKELGAVEQLKYQGAKAFDLHALNTAMKEEQVLIMTLRGYEQKRILLFKALNLPERTPLSQLEQILSPAVRREFSDYTKQLLSSYRFFLSIYEKTRNILEMNARLLDRHIQDLDKRTTLGRPYKQDGSSEIQSFHRMKNIQI